MLGFLEGITLEYFFIACAVLGGALFLVRVILMFIGAGHDDVDGAGIDGDVHDMSDVHHGEIQDSDISFKVLSLQGITAFFMMFGLVGLAILKQGTGGALWSIGSIVGGTGAGLITVWVLGKIFLMMMHLQSTSELNVEEAVGQEGTVYLTIPPEGAGKIQVTVRGSLRVYDAVSEGSVEIKTGERILVSRVIHENVMVVTRAAET